MGLKLDVMMQLPPGARLTEQLLDSVKLFAEVPVRTILKISKAPLPVLDNVTVRAELDVPNVTEPNVTEDDETSVAGKEPMGMPIIGPHPKLQANASVSVAVKINLKKRRNCIIRLPICLAIQISVKP